MRVLISGAGIAGPTLAYWLLRYGFQVTLCETAPCLRTGGYIIDFWGAGLAIAERMGLLPEISRKACLVQEVRVVNRRGKRIAGFPAAAFTRAAGGRYMSLPRSELAASIFGRIQDRVETIFDNRVNRIEQTEQAAHVTFEDGAKREFDLVIGADGLHSRVRELAFGAESQFEIYLGYKAAAFEVEGYRPRDEQAYVMYAEVGKQVARFSMKDDRTMFLLTFADPEAAKPDDLQAQKRILRKCFGQAGWECPQILAALDAANDLYFDRVSQIRMGPKGGLWTQGRITLVGDAASCISLLGGQGSALAMVAAYILAGELHRANGNYAEAFARYRNLFGPFVFEKQKTALRFANVFAPSSGFALFLRNQLFNLLAIPGLADLALGRGFSDKLTLPDYE